MKCEVEILNPLGLHARPAAEFVKTVRQFHSKVFIHHGTEVISAGSILELLGADLSVGTQLTLEAEGPDAEAALARLRALLVEFAKREN